MRRIHSLDDDGRPHNIFQYSIVGKEVELLTYHASEEARLVDKRLVLLALGARRYPEIRYFNRSFRRSSRKLMHRNIVPFSEPLLPMTQITSRSWTSRSIPLTHADDGKTYGGL